MFFHKVPPDAAERVRSWMFCCLVFVCVVRMFVCVCLCGKKRVRRLVPFCHVGCLLELLEEREG